MIMEVSWALGYNVKSVRLDQVQCRRWASGFSRVNGS